MLDENKKYVWMFRNKCSIFPHHRDVEMVYVSNERKIGKYQESTYLIFTHHVMWEVRKCKKHWLHYIKREICYRQSLRHSTASVHIPVNMLWSVSVNAVVTPSAASTLHVGVTPYSLYESVFVTYLNKITFLYCAQNIISSASPWFPFPQCRKKQVCIRHQDFLLTLLQGVS